MSELDLTLPHRLWRGLHNGLARAGVPKWVPVPVRPEGGYYVVSADLREVAVPSAMRWEHYRFGWDKRVARLFRHFSVGDKIKVAPGDHVIDIGANVGEMSLGLAALGANALAIEGDPKVFECLSRNVADTANITPVQGLVWKAAERLTFYSAPTKADSSIFRPDDAQEVQTVELDAHPLDILAENHGLDGIAFIKCDAEGAEPEVLEGAADVLKRTRQIALDTGPEREGAETGAECEAILKSHGFTVSHSTQGRKITFGIRT